MKKVSKKDISLWIHRNAREIDVARFKYHFENGDKYDVVNALMLYQNADGGFGNTLDPDNWNPNSLPYATFYAIGILREIEFFDLEHPIHKGIFKYLNEEAEFPNGWIFTVQSNQDYPHASYYNYSEEYNKTESIGIILGFSSFILEYYSGTAIFQKIETSLAKYIELIYKENLGDMGPSGYITLVNAMKKAGLSGYNYDELDKKLKELVYNSIQRKPEQWPYYGYRPSDYIKSKDSIFYQDNQDIIAVELDFLADSLPQNDVWPISWSWFDNKEIYPLEAAISNVWCKAYKAIEKSLFLRNFDRID